MSAAKYTPPFELVQGCEEFIVVDSSGQAMAKCEARFDSATREFHDHDDAEARAKQIAAALNVAFYLAIVTGSAK